MSLTRPFIALAVGVALCSAAQAAPDRDVLYQVSTLDALLAGVFDRVASIGELLAHGDTGIGCFEALDGEMIVLNGKAYQVRADGSVHRATPSMGAPFAAVTYLDPDREVSLDQPLDLKGLQALLDRQLPSRSLFYILRLEGEFAYVKTRSVPRQHQPYPKLSDVAARQPTFAFENTAGTLVGLFCPYFVNGANLPGYHFHFLNALRTGGGHVLDLRLVRGKLTVDTTPRYLLALPESGPFTAAKLDKANTAEMQKVEQDRK